MTRRILLLVLGAVCAARAAVPDPEGWFGHRMGADRKLIRWERVTAYFDALAAASDRIRVERIGQTVDGKQMVAAFIADAETLRNLERYRALQARLADPRRTSAAESETAIAAGKSVVMITCSVHSTEVASTMTAIEFAHRLLTEQSPKLAAIRANTILILVPSLNPDGIDIVEEWYAKTLGTAYEGTGPPELYHRYIGHDNNRDWYIFSQPETRNVIERLHNVWRPHIVYDVHQQGPYGSRMFVPPWLDPIEPNIDPIIAQLCNSIGAGIASDLTSAGMTGIAINAIYDFWTPARHYQAYHGGLRILSETASARLATPITVRPDQISRLGHGYDPRRRSWNHLEPWLGGEWRLRDIVDYQLVAFESCLYQAAMRREDLLRAMYKVALRAVERREPSAFIVPEVQFDPGAARQLLEILRFGSIEIDRANSAFRAGGSDYPAGTYVIRMQQPYSSWAKTLLEVQEYPDLRAADGSPRRPYDVTAHTLPLLMGVDVRVAKEPFTAELNRVDRISFRQSDGGADIDEWRAGGRNFKTRRIGLYRSWVPNMDEGWTRWLLERFGYAYTTVRNVDLQSTLRSRFDVIIFPDLKAEIIHTGYDPGLMPAQYVGGVGDAGIKELKRFVTEGGTLIFLNEACQYALDRFELGIRNVVKGLPETEYYSPGSILNARLDAAHSLARGLPSEIRIWSEGSPVFELPGRSKARAVVQYPDRGILASGWLLGEKHLKGRAALVEAPVGKGHIILFGMRPQYRAQSYQTFKLLFNALQLSD